MNTKRAGWALFSALVFCVAAILWSLPTVRQADTAYRDAARTVVLIDAGHGGMDGGTTGTNGQSEKALNLAIAEKLASVLQVMGYDVQMTRADDRSLHSSDAVTIREKKVSDMKARLAMYEQAALVVSIHQNHFTQSQYHGTQVFYAPKNAQSQPLAESIRHHVVSLLQPDNTRELKSADKTLYLMANTTVPTALVECGFLSNKTECENLCDTEYQRQMAFAVAGGIAAFLCGES